MTAILLKNIDDCSHISHEGSPRIHHTDIINNNDTISQIKHDLTVEKIESNHDIQNYVEDNGSNSVQSSVHTLPNIMSNNITDVRQSDDHQNISTSSNTRPHDKELFNRQDLQNNSDQYHDDNTDIINTHIPLENIEDDEESEYHHIPLEELIRRSCIVTPVQKTRDTNNSKNNNTKSSHSYFGTISDDEIKNDISTSSYFINSDNMKEETMVSDKNKRKQLHLFQKMPSSWLKNNSSLENSEES